MGFFNVRFVVIQDRYVRLKIFLDGHVSRIGRVHVDGYYVLLIGTVMRGVSVQVSDWCMIWTVVGLGYYFRLTDLLTGLASRTVQHTSMAILLPHFNNRIHVFAGRWSNYDKTVTYFIDGMVF